MKDYELRVREGPQQGACARLREGKAVRVGASIDSDIVLRGSDADERRFVLTPEGNQLRVQVLQGELMAGSRKLGAGQSASVGLGTHLELGGTCLSVEPVMAAADEEAPVPEATTPPAASWRTALGTRPWPRNLAAAGGTLACLSIGMLALAYTAAPGGATAEQQARRAQTLLAGAGLSRLVVQALPDRSLRVSGYLDTAAQRASAEQLLAGEKLPAQWQVFVDEQLAAQVQDVFRTHGVQAQVHTAGAGEVRVSASAIDPLAVEAVAAAARRDVPGLAKLELKVQPVAAAQKVRTIDDPGKRVASIVGGDPPYVVTVDGTRYFQGALLPTGHRIAAIAERQVVLELNGVQTPLVF